MQSREELIEAARNMSDFLKMGEPLDSICGHLGKMQKKYEKQWTAIGRESASGERLAPLLRKYGMWPDEMCAAVEAGEESGKLEMILENIMVFQDELSKVGKVVKAKIMAPSIFIAAGIAIFIGFMTFVLPGVSGGIKDPRDRTGLIAISDWFVDIKENHLVTVGLIAAISITFLIGMLQTQAVRKGLAALVDGTPGLGHGLRSVNYGLWAKFMVILDQTNSIPIERMIAIASRILPNSYRSSTDILEREVASPQGANWACDHNRWKKTDPRQEWPLRLKISLHSAASTGNIKDSLGRSADPLIRDGIANIEKTLGFFNLLAMAIAAGGILTPMAGMMLVQLQVVNSMK